LLLPLKAFFENRPLAGDLLAVVAGCIYPLAMSPFGLWPLELVALTALALLTSSASIKRGALRFYLFAAGMYGVGISWVYVSIHEHGGASPLLAGFLVVLFVLSLSLVFLVHGYLYMRFIKPAPLGILLGFPVTWFLREWVLTWLLTGFPWLFAGYGAIDTWMVGYAPVTGVLGLGFLLALQASMLAWAVRVPGWRRGLPAAAVVAAVWATGWIFSRVEFTEPVGRRFTVSAVQGDVDQHIKWNRNMVGPIVEKYVSLTSGEWGRDMIVWPEAAITLFRFRAGSFLADMRARGEKSGTTLVLGIPDISEDGRFLNTAVALGNGEGTYIKRRLVPFGEYVPLEGMLRGLIQLFDLPMSHNESGPDNQTPLRAGELVLSLSICYEVVYPGLVRKTVENPDVLVTISNDTWFGDSIGPWQHMEMARMRAIENGRYMVRATNNGVTAIVDHRGRIVGMLPQFREGVLRGEIEKRRGKTPFARYGHGPLLLLLALVLAGMLVLRFEHVSEQPIR